MLHNPLLRRYWFNIEGYNGIGVTAFSLADAEAMCQDLLSGWSMDVEVIGVIEDVDVQQLPTDVKGRMGPPNFRGVWYPSFNLTGPYRRQ